MIVNVSAVHAVMKVLKCLIFYPSLHYKVTAGRTSSFLTAIFQFNPSLSAYTSHSWSMVIVKTQCDTPSKEHFMTNLSFIVRRNTKYIDPSMIDDPVLILYYD